MTEIAVEKTSTLIIPLPMEMLKYFDNKNALMEKDLQKKD
jgi:hypothetical protein